MKEDFNYDDVPNGYLHCLNAECSRSADCLRYMLACHVRRQTPSFSIVNPAFVAEQEECPYFRPDQFTRFALGITHLFDNLSHPKAVKIRGVLRSHFGRSMFYRISDKQRLIKPEEQDFIRQAFIAEGIAEQPVFDQYIDRYSWL